MNRSENTKNHRKGMDSTLALIITIVVGLMVVLIIVAILNSNTGNLETFAQDGVNVDLW